MSVLSRAGTKPFQSLKEATQHVVREALLSSQQATKGSRDDTDTNVLLRKCGDLACQHDSFQKTLSDARILSMAEYQEQSTGKKNKKKSSSGYVIVPTDTIFFPEGGGQPCDQGTLTILEKGNDDCAEVMLKVQEAKNEKGVCVLNCVASGKGDLDSSLLHRILGIATITRESQVYVEQELDWKRRFDFMTQHSAQHLVSAEAFNLFGIETHSFSLQPRGESYLDLVVSPDTSLNENIESMKRVEGVVNERIRDNLKMTPKWLDPEDEAFKTKVRSRLLPDGLTGMIRLVEIDHGSIDCNTCCGTHVPSLGHLQMIKFFKTVKAKQNILRVWFAAGTRLLDIMQDSSERQDQITSLLSCNPQEHVTRVEQLLEDRRVKEKEIKALSERLCVMQAKEIVQECESANGVAVVDLGSSADMGFMSQLSTTVLNQVNASAKPVLLLFVQGEKDKGTFLLSGSDAEMVGSVGKRVAQELGGRGGGKNGRYQGKGTNIESGLPEAKRMLIEVLGGKT